MCQVRTKAQITSMQDVQNLVTACILRSQEPYSIPEVTRKVVAECVGSRLPVSGDQVTELVRDTTTALLRTKYLSVKKGRYYPVFVASKLSKREVGTGILQAAESR